MVQLYYSVLDRAIAPLYYSTVGGKGRHLPTTEDIPYSRKENKRMYSSRLDMRDATGLGT